MKLGSRSKSRVSCVACLDIVFLYGNGWVNSKSLEGSAPCNQGPPASRAPRREVPSGPNDPSDSNNDQYNVSCMVTIAFGSQHVSVLSRLREVRPV